MFSLLQAQPRSRLLSHLDCRDYSISSSSYITCQGLGVIAGVGVDAARIAAAAFFDVRPHIPQQAYFFFFFFFCHARHPRHDTTRGSLSLHRPAPDSASAYQLTRTRAAPASPHVAKKRPVRIHTYTRTILRQLGQCEVPISDPMSKRALTNIPVKNYPKVTA